MAKSEVLYHYEGQQSTYFQRSEKSGDSDVSHDNIEPTLEQNICRNNLSRSRNI